MQAQEQEAVYGVNASSTYDSSVYDPTYAEPQYWDVAEDAAYQPTFESTHSKFCRSYREHCFATLYLYLERQRVNYWKLSYIILSIIWNFLQAARVGVTECSSSGGLELGVQSSNFENLKLLHPVTSKSGPILAIFQVYTFREHIIE